MQSIAIDTEALRRLHADAVALPHDVLDQLALDPTDQEIVELHSRHERCHDAGADQSANERRYVPSPVHAFLPEPDGNAGSVEAKQLGDELTMLGKHDQPL